MARVYNFSAGPSMLPKEVLETAAAEMLEYGNSGQSVMEMSHRSKEYQAIIDAAEADLREIMNIPDNYEGAMCVSWGMPKFSMIGVWLSMVIRFMMLCTSFMWYDGNFQKNRRQKSLMPTSPNGGGTVINRCCETHMPRQNGARSISC